MQNNCSSGTMDALIKQVCLQFWLCRVLELQAKKASAHLQQARAGLDDPEKAFSTNHD
jgi:hypothetical protein